MAEDGLRRQEAALLVEDAAHILVGAAEAFHQDVAFAVTDHADGLGNGLEFVLVVDDGEDGRVDLLVLADFQDLVLVADEGDFDDAFLDGLGCGGDGMVIDAPGGDHAFLAPGAEDFEQFVKGGNHSAIGFLIIVDNVHGVGGDDQFFVGRDGHDFDA